MNIFVSAGEPSGDIHGANLIRALKQREPDARIVGFGGERMEKAGSNLLFLLTHLAVMWFKNVLANIRQFVQLGKQAEAYFHNEKPDAVVLIDFPGFHFALAKRAHAAGIPVYFFVPPQLWGWAGWRVKKVRKWFKGVLTALPFEEDWYRDRGVATKYVGHPYFDELAQQTLDETFLTEQRTKGGPIIGVLPGSRNQEVAGNFAMMLRSLKLIHASRPDARFLVASFKESQREMAESMARDSGLPIEFHVGRTPEIIELSTICLSVSGSVSLEMLHRLKPTVIVYHVGLVFRCLAGLLMRAKYITLVNLLADEPIFPEMYGYRDRSKPIATQVLSWLNDPHALAERVEKIRSLRDRVAMPGACDRAADFLVSRIRTDSARRSAA